MKYCAKCKTGKCETEFTKEKARPDGLRVWCRACCLKGKDSIKFCSSCGLTKHNRCFSADKSSKTGFCRVCRECLSVRVKTFKKFIKPKSAIQEISEEQNDYLALLLKRKKSDSKRKGIRCDFTLNWMREQFCNGCALTGIPFKIGKNNPFSIEVDRIIPGGDYSMKNSRFVCGIYNRMKWTYTDEDVFKMTLSLVINNWEEYQKYFRFRGLIKTKNL